MTWLETPIIDECVRTMDKPTEHAQPLVRSLRTGKRRPRARAHARTQAGLLRHANGRGGLDAGPQLQARREASARHSSQEYTLEIVKPRVYLRDWVTFHGCWSSTTSTTRGERSRTRIHPRTRARTHAHTPNTHTNARTHTRTRTHAHTHTSCMRACRACVRVQA